MQKMNSTGVAGGRLVRRIGGATGAIAMIGGAATVFGSPVSAGAAPGETCEATTPAATLIADGVCELRITTSGSYTFPSSITKLSAVLVGGGGGGRGVSTGDYAGFGGGGGAVTYVDSVALDVPLAVTIGAGGVADFTGGDPAAIGGATSLGADSAAGGLVSSGVVGGSSGNGYAGSRVDGPSPTNGASGSGGGAGSAAPDGATPGAGVTLSAVATDAVLFPASLDGTEVFGLGGTGAPMGSSLVAIEPNSGQGGSAVGGDNGSGGGTTVSPLRSAGADGVIVMRFPATQPPAPAPSAPELAATGVSDADAGVALAGAAALLGGAALVVASRRLRARDDA